MKVLCCKGLLSAFPDSWAENHRDKHARFVIGFRRDLGEYLIASLPHHNVKRYLAR